MRLNILFFWGCVFYASLACGQSETKFTIEVFSKEVRLGEPFEVKFQLENGENGNFLPPDWESAGFAILSSSQSSSFTFSNGRSSATAIYQYQIMARDTGLLEIPSAVLKNGAKEWKTTPQSIHVLPGDSSRIPAPRNRQSAPPPVEDPKKKIKTIHL